MNEYWKKALVLFLVVVFSFSAGFFFARVFRSESIESLSRTIDEAITANRDLEEELQRSENTVEQLEVGIRASREIIDNLLGQNTNLRETVGELAAENNELRSTAAELSRNLRELRDATGIIGVSIGGLEAQFESSASIIREIELLLRGSENANQ